MSGRRSPGSSPTPGLLAAIRIDLERLHAGWMSLVYPRQLESAHSVLGRWTPDTALGRVKYRLWGAVGLAVLVLVYPLVVAGFAIRFYARRVDKAAVSLGFVGVFLLSVLVWGALSAAAYFSRISYEGFLAIAAAGGVATVSAVLALLFSRVGGRFTTVFLGYPFGVTALFLPPVVAALYSPTLAAVIFPRSQTLAIWLLDNVLVYGGIGEYLQARFRLAGFAYVGMWFGLAIPVGWFLGILVSLANLVRPSSPDESGDDG